MLMRIGLLNYVAGALVMPYDAFHAAASGPAPRHGGDRRALRRVVRAGLPPAVHPAARRRPRRAVLLPAGRSRRQRVQTLLRRGLSRSPASAAPARAGWSTRRSPSPTRFRFRSPNCPTARPISASPRPSPSRWRAGGSRGRRMSSPWAVPWPTPPTSSMPTAWTWIAPASASACPAGCATGPTAAAEPFRRWSTGCRWTRRRQDRRRTGSRQSPVRPR